jgi:alkylation response protein AidB-like acyl-CoA dehydrogenase
MNDTALLLRDAVARLLGDVLSREIRQAAAQGDWQTLWQAADELGLPTLLVPETAGGSGVTLTEAFAVLEQLGQFAVPCPLAETMIANRLLHSHGLPLPAGALALAPVLAHQPPLQLQRTAAGWQLNGELHGVPWGRQVAAIVTVAHSADAAMLCLITQAGLRTAAAENLAGEARDSVYFADTGLAPQHVVQLAGADLLWHSGALLRCVQIAGALSAVLTLSVDYAQERKQFGRPIARFQAIQQQLATLASETSAARAAARRAFMSLDTPAPFAVAAAKIYAGRAASQAAAIAHQVHGAIGFTREYQLQLLTRRLWAWREEFGNESWWGERLGRQLAAAGADTLWPQLAAD